MKRFSQLLPLVGLLLVFFYIRVHHVENLLYFVDELRHIGRAQVVWKFTDIDISTTPHKSLVYYWMGLFGLPVHLPGWLARTSVAIFSLLGGAGTYALGRELFSKRVGLVSLLVLSFFPFMYFFDRMALSDPLASALSVIVAWWSVVTARRPTHTRSVALGLLITFMLIAKVLTVPLIALPIMAGMLLSKNSINFKLPLKAELLRLWGIYKPHLITFLGITGVIWGIIMGFYVIRARFSNEPASPIVNSYLYDSRGPAYNMGRFMDTLEHFWGWPLVAITILAIVILAYRKPYHALFLWFGPVVLWGTLLLVARQFTTRYITIAGHLAVVGIVAGLFELLTWWQGRPYQRVAWLPISVLVLWVVGFGGNFWGILIDDPLQLELPARDQHEYFRNQTGYGLRDALYDVAARPNVSVNSEVPVVVGIVRNCSFLLHHIPEDLPLKVECSVYSYLHRYEWPPFGMRMRHLHQVLDAHDEVYLIVENLSELYPMLDYELLGADAELLKVYHRPFDGIDVEVYRLFRQKQYRIVG